MAIFVVLWPYRLTTKLSCLQKDSFGHTNALVHCTALPTPAREVLNVVAKYELTVLLYYFDKSCFFSCLLKKLL